MKNITLSLIFSILITPSLQAIDPGKYYCHGEIVNLKKSGNFRLEYTDGEVYLRGKWDDDDDEAILNYIESERVGTNMFGLGGVEHQTKETLIFTQTSKNNFTCNGYTCIKYTKQFQEQLKKEEEARLAKEKKRAAERRRIKAEQVRLAEQRRIKAEQARLAEQRRIKAEQARLAEQRRIKAEQARLKKIQEDRAKLKQFTGVGISKKDALFFIEEDISLSQAMKMSKNKK